MTTQPLICNFRQFLSSILTNRRSAEQRSVSSSVTIDRRIYRTVATRPTGEESRCRCALKPSEVSTTRRVCHGKEAFTGSQ